MNVKGMKFLAVLAVLALAFSIVAFTPSELTAVETNDNVYLENALEYKYDPAYKYSGECEVSGNVLEMTYETVSGDALMFDYARFLGGLYRGNVSEEVASVTGLTVFGVDYEWIEEVGLIGNNWAHHDEESEEYVTLVSVVTEAFNEVPDNKLSMKMTAENVVYDIEIQTNIQALSIIDGSKYPKMYGDVDEIDLSAGGNLLVFGILEDVTVTLGDEGKVTLTDGASFSGEITHGDSTVTVAGIKAAGENGLTFAAGSIEISGEMTADELEAEIAAAEGDVILNGVTVTGGSIELTDVQVGEYGLTISEGATIVLGSDLVIKDGSLLSIAGTIKTTTESDSRILLQNVENVKTTGTAKIEVDIVDYESKNPVYPDYEDGTIVKKYGTDYVIGHALTTAGTVQFGTAVGGLIYSGHDYAGPVNNVAVASFDNIFGGITGEPYAIMYGDDAGFGPTNPQSLDYGECIHAGAYNLYVRFTMAANSAAVSVTAWLNGGIKISQIDSDGVDIVRYDYTTVYGAKVSDIGTFTVEDFTISGQVFYYNGVWTQGTWPEEMSEGYYFVFATEYPENPLGEGKGFPDATFSIDGTEYKAYDGYLLKFIGTTIPDVSSLDGLNFYIDLDGTDGEYDDYEPTMYPITIQLEAVYGFKLVKIDDEKTLVDYTDEEGSDVVAGSIQKGLNYVVEIDESGEFDYIATASGELLWFDGLTGDGDPMYGYFIAFEIKLPNGKGWANVVATLNVNEEDPIIIDDPEFSGQFVVPYADDESSAPVITVTLVMDEAEETETTFAIDLEGVKYQTLAGYYEDAPEEGTKIHGFKSEEAWPSDMAYLVFAATDGVSITVYALQDKPIDDFDPTDESTYVDSSESFESVGAFERFWYGSFADGGDLAGLSGYEGNFVIVASQDDDVITRGGFVRGAIPSLVELVGYEGEDEDVQAFVDAVLVEIDFNETDIEDSKIIFADAELHYVGKDLAAKLGLEKSGYYIAFQMNYNDEIIPETSAVEFDGVTGELSEKPGLYWVYLGADKNRLQGTEFTVDFDGDDDTYSAVDYTLEVRYISTPELTIILQEDDYEDLYITANEGDHYRLPNGKDSTKTFVRWSLNDSTKEYAYDSIYLVMGADADEDGYITFIAKYAAEPEPEPVDYGFYTVTYSIPDGERFTISDYVGVGESYFIAIPYFEGYSMYVNGAESDVYYKYDTMEEAGDVDYIVTYHEIEPEPVDYVTLTMTFEGVEHQDITLYYTIDEKYNVPFPVIDGYVPVALDGEPISYYSAIGIMEEDVTVTVTYEVVGSSLAPAMEYGAYLGQIDDYGVIAQIIGLDGGYVTGGNIKFEIKYTIQAGSTKIAARNPVTLRRGSRSFLFM